MKSKITNYPNLNKILKLVSEESPLQKKRINAFLGTQDDEYFIFSENLSKILIEKLIRTEREQVEAAQAYNKMCRDFLYAQIQFQKTGKYPISDALIAKTLVYDEVVVMKYYMVGLLLSYMFWPNHYKLFKFFEKHLEGKSFKSYLEVGVGHGLFTAVLKNKLPNIRSTIIDISKTSILAAQSLLDAFGVDKLSMQFIHGDFMDVPQESESFDFIILGEVLEHVNDGDAFLKKAKKLLNRSGIIYLSTAANSPALDHVLHFKNISEIHTMIVNAGLAIIDEVAYPAENVPESRWEAEMVTINYCAILGLSE
jgi:2-polyprenyl-3-methyl-5-hydroxy-6-metoxy-1,4-benzoquinol methylase